MKTGNPRFFNKAKCRIESEPLRRILCIQPSCIIAFSLNLGVMLKENYPRDISWVAAAVVRIPRGLRLPELERKN